MQTSKYEETVFTVKLVALFLTVGAGIAGAALAIFFPQLFLTGLFSILPGVLISIVVFAVIIRLYLAIRDGW